MAKPILQNVGVFDAEKEKVFRFTWYGHSLASNTLTIYEQDTDKVVYPKEISTSEKDYTHLLAGGTLTNGVSYYAILHTCDIYGNVSSPSNKITFKCVAMPTFEIDIDNDTVIESSTVQVSVSFNHTTDKIKTLKFYLADVDNKVLIESDDITYESDDDTIYKFLGLKNETEYHIYATCTTVGGFEIETEMKSIIIRHDSYDFGGSCYIDCHPTSGDITCKTAFVIIEYNGNKTFNYSNSFIDLTNDSICYDDGFSINGDVNICLKVKNAVSNKPLFIGSNGKDYELKVYLYECPELSINGYVVGLIVTCGKLKYNIFSEPFLIQTNDVLEIWIKKNNEYYGCYGIDVVNKTNPELIYSNDYIENGEDYTATEEYLNELQN